MGQSDTRCGTSQAAAEQVAIHGAEGHTWQENSSKSNIFPWSRHNIKMLIYFRFPFKLMLAPSCLEGPEENYGCRDKLTDRSLRFSTLAHTVANDGWPKQREQGANWGIS